MNSQQTNAYTVEYQDLYGITYYDEVLASSIGDAERQVRSKRPEASIRAITLNPKIDDEGRTVESISSIDGDSSAAH
ncbi:hypothetical protein DFQ01_12467 [Paenibacillus cellulosilyticus]|uniref:Uncharacterized protein n=2 Tax=Paenibacillus cellulosilyticus TaxID=375489 RepID=A0A2V2YN92_9BACL|nr:hypothetical protein DFQ01_12467 [Paenibacillus cellulosilyticus]